MELSWFRDLVIVILGFLFIVGGIVFFILFIDLYGRVKKMISTSNELVTSLKDTANIAKEAAVYARDRLSKPMVELASLLQVVEKVTQTFKNVCASIRGNRKESADTETCGK